MGWLGGGGVGGGGNDISISTTSSSTEFVMYLRNEAFVGCPKALFFLCDKPTLPKKIR